MSKIVKLTESDLNRIVKKVMNEAPIIEPSGDSNPAVAKANPAGLTGQSGNSGPNAMVNVNLFKILMFTSSNRVILWL